ncbi:hypothetical protein TNCV_3264901 [Trichonephila clavipes]|nr:hypothetical protein TNCV_3264901 [Trichonephila clavipes]
MLIGETNGTEIEIVLKFKQFVRTFPIHGIQGDSIGQRKTIVPNTQHGQSLALEKDLGIFLGRGHQLLFIKGSPKHSGFIPLIRGSKIGSSMQPGFWWPLFLIPSFLVPSFLIWSFPGSRRTMNDGINLLDMGLLDRWNR